MWSSWTSCSVSCGGGDKKRVRNCTNPEPALGGNECAGLAEISEICGTNRCPSMGMFL